MEHRVPDLRRGPGQALPAFSGRLSRLVLPTGPGIRLECGVAEGVEVSVHYDPLLAKLVVSGATREEAIARMAVPSTGASSTASRL
jgi:acetyl/propionyl-CoA carboxylase alpha subunit